MDLGNERNLMETAKRSVVKWAGIQIWHDLVEDSKIVAPPYLFTFRFENQHCATQTMCTRRSKRLGGGAHPLRGLLQSQCAPATQTAEFQREEIECRPRRSRFLPVGVMISESAVEGTRDLLNIDLNLRI